MTQDREKAFRERWLENMRGLLRDHGKTEAEADEEANRLWIAANEIADDHRRRVAENYRR